MMLCDEPSCGKLMAQRSTASAARQTFGDQRLGHQRRPWHKGRLHSGNTFFSVQGSSR